MSKSPYRTITEKERRLLLKIAETNPHGFWVKAMLYCGLGPGETALVQGRDIDLAHKTLHIRETKSSPGRTVSIPETLIENFKGFDPDAYVFGTRYGTPLTRKRMAQWWRTLKRDMNLELGAKTYKNKLLEDRLPELKNSPDDLNLTISCLQSTYYAERNYNGQTSGHDTLLHQVSNNHQAP